VWRKVCHPTRFAIPARSAAGWRYRFSTMAGLDSGFADGDILSWLADAGESSQLPPQALVGLDNPVIAAAVDWLQSDYETPGTRTAGRTPRCGQPAELALLPVVPSPPLKHPPPARQGWRRESVNPPCSVQSPGSIPGTHADNWSILTSPRVPIRWILRRGEFYRWTKCQAINDGDLDQPALVINPHLRLCRAYVETHLFQDAIQRT